MAAPWTAPLADSPAAVGLKNGGLSEITQDIIYPASRPIDGDFSSGRSLEYRFRSDSSRHWLPRESRMLVEYEFAFGETSHASVAENRKRRKLTSDERAKEARQAKKRLSSVQMAETVYG